MEGGILERMESVRLHDVGLKGTEQGPQVPKYFPPKASLRLRGKLGVLDLFELNRRAAGPLREQSSLHCRMAPCNQLLGKLRGKDFGTARFVAGY